jgi:hypothetical protein
VQALASLTLAYPGGAAYPDDNTEAHRVFGELVKSGHVVVVPTPDDEPLEGMTTYALSAEAVQAQRALIEQRADDAAKN